MSTTAWGLAHGRGCQSLAAACRSLVAGGNVNLNQNWHGPWLTLLAFMGQGGHAVHALARTADNAKVRSGSKKPGASQRPPNDFSLPFKAAPYSAARKEV